MNKNNETTINNSPSEQLLDNLSQGKTNEDDEIVQKAYKQKAAYEKQKEEWKRKDKQAKLREMTLLDENTMMRADLDDMKDMMDNLKQKIMLDQKVANRKVVPESPQTTEEIVANALAEVIKERKEKALKEKGRKESRPVGNNIFHI
jgi:hypothetical protein